MNVYNRPLSFPMSEESLRNYTVSDRKSGFKIKVPHGLIHY